MSPPLGDTGFLGATEAGLTFRPEGDLGGLQVAAPASVNISGTSPDGSFVGSADGSTGRVGSELQAPDDEANRMEDRLIHPTILWLRPRVRGSAD